MSRTEPPRPQTPERATTRVYRIENDSGMGPYTDESTPERRYLVEILHVCHEDTFVPAQDDGLPVGGDWLSGCLSEGDLMGRFGDFIELLSAGGYQLAEYDVLVDDVRHSLSGTQVAFSTFASRSRRPLTRSGPTPAYVQDLLA